MEDKHELEFADLLQSYQVKDAVPELLERIVAAAAESKVIAFKRPVYAMPLMRYAAIAAALAVLGFFCGTATLSEGENVATAGNASLDRVIMGPASYSEISL